MADTTFKGGCANDNQTSASFRPQHYCPWRSTAVRQTAHRGHANARTETKGRQNNSAAERRHAKSFGEIRRCQVRRRQIGCAQARADSTGQSDKARAETIFQSVSTSQDNACSGHADTCAEIRGNTLAR